MSPDTPDTPDTPETAEKLCRRAEAVLERLPESSNLADRQSADALVRELAVRQAELELRNEKLLESEERFRRLLVDLPMLAVQGYLPDGTTIYWNRGSENTYGYSAQEALGKNLLDLIIPPEIRDFVRRSIKDMTDAGIPESASELQLMRKDGTLVPVFSSHMVFSREGRPSELFCFDLDLSDIKHGENERKRLQEQLAQAQKMESVGRLAGGVAHDFNNMLSVILGYGESILGDLRVGDPLRRKVEQIVAAGERSAALTRQLLAFSRKQTLRPEVLDINAVARNLEKMLRRLIGEDIALELALADEVGRVMADPGQIEQVIMNLAVNARDAMPAGGTLIMETADVELDGVYAEGHPDARPGTHTMLAMTDTGCGMDEETLSKIFEPFFTTKEMGKGTGLGLSTVYGIVKQSGGHISACSEPGHGTTFKIYLPRTEVKHEPTAGAVYPRGAGGRGEHILVVEDEKSVRDLMGKVLSQLGYQVSLAANGGEAVLLVEEKGLRPDLVITDVVMPNMSGKEVAVRLRRAQPDLRVLYMSGYTEDAIVHHGVLEPGTAFMQKPFSLRALAERVEAVLGRQGQRSR